MSALISYLKIGGGGSALTGGRLKVETRVHVFPIEPLQETASPFPPVKRRRLFPLEVFLPETRVYKDSLFVESARVVALRTKVTTSCVAIFQNRHAVFSQLTDAYKYEGTLIVSLTANKLSMYQ